MESHEERIESLSSDGLRQQPDFGESHEERIESQTTNTLKSVNGLNRNLTKRELKGHSPRTAHRTFRRESHEERIESSASEARASRAWARESHEERIESSQREVT